MIWICAATNAVVIPTKATSEERRALTKYAYDNKLPVLIEEEWDLFNQQVEEEIEHADR